MTYETVDQDALGGGRLAGASRWRVPRGRGAASGALLVLLGAWGALIPFIGPYFDFGFTPNTTWTWTSARFWLEVLPGGAAALGGLILVASTSRVAASAGAWLACAAGAWFIVGPPLSALWNPGTLGQPLGSAHLQSAEWIGFFYGVGTVILFLAATALGRLTVVGVRDVRRLDAATAGGWRSGGIHRHGRGADARVPAGGTDATTATTPATETGPGDTSEQRPIE